MKENLFNSHVFYHKIYILVGFNLFPSRFSELVLIRLRKYYCIYFAVLLLFACNPYAKLVSVETAVINLKASEITEEDDAITMEIAPYKSILEKSMSGVLAYSEQVMVKGYPEGLLGNFVADLILKKANDYYSMLNAENNSPNVDFCILNNGGLRADLPEGKITKTNIYELMPFENELVVLTLSGNKTKELFDFLAKYDGMPLAGAKMGIKDGAAIDILVNGKPFNISKNYRVVTSDYLANGGDKMYFFKEPVRTEELEHRKVRDAIIEYLIEENAKGNKLKAQLDGRIYYVE